MFSTPAHQRRPCFTHPKGTGYKVMGLKVFDSGRGAWFQTPLCCQAHGRLLIRARLAAVGRCQAGREMTACLPPNSSPDSLLFLSLTPSFDIQKNLRPERFPWKTQRGEDEVHRNATCVTSWHIQSCSAALCDFFFFSLNWSLEFLSCFDEAKVSSRRSHTIKDHNAVFFFFFSCACLGTNTGPLNTCELRCAEVWDTEHSFVSLQRIKNMEPFGTFTIQEHQRAWSRTRSISSDARLDEQ